MNTAPHHRPSRHVLRHLRRWTAMIAWPLLIAVIVLWARSHQRGDAVSKLGPTGIELRSQRGQITLARYRGFPEPMPWRWTPRGTSHRHVELPGFKNLTESGGAYTLFGLVKVIRGSSTYQTATIPVRKRTVHWRAFGLPHWLIALPLAALAVGSILPAAAHRWRRWRSPGIGRCTGCGYDLRGSSGRCPECGRARDHAIPT